MVGDGRLGDEVPFRNKKKLLGCPFCGRESYVSAWRIVPGFYAYFVGCQYCCFEIRRESNKEAIDTWNGLYNKRLDCK